MDPQMMMFLQLLQKKREEQNPDNDVLKGGRSGYKNPDATQEMLDKQKFRSLMGAGAGAQLGQGLGGGIAGGLGGAALGGLAGYYAPQIKSGIKSFLGN